MSAPVLLFDVDGTLTIPMKPIADDMIECLRIMKQRGYELSVVGGSDYAKIASQLTGALDVFEYICSENGAVTYHNGTVIPTSNILKTLGENAYQEVINTILYELSQIKIPVKRDKFIEVRSMCINISPIGRSCSYEERLQFHEYDKEYKVRECLVASLQPMLTKHNLVAVIGGMISIDIFPEGFDKRYCLKFFPDRSQVHFFGDRTEPGGNDFWIYIDPRVTGHSVKDPNHLQQLLLQLDTY